MIPAPDGTVKGKLEYRAFIRRSRADGFVRLRFAGWGGAARNRLRASETIFLRSISARYDVRSGSSAGAEPAGPKTAHNFSGRSSWQLLLGVFSVSQSDSGGHYEYLFLPKALAVLDSFAAPPLVGSKEAPHATRQD
jgi:hypothetical protein